MKEIHHGHLQHLHHHYIHLGHHQIHGLLAEMTLLNPNSMEGLLSIKKGEGEALLNPHH
jgi:hypothetical protein